MSIEEFLSSENQLTDLTQDSELKTQNLKLILHGHCHQKSSYGTKGTKQALAQTGCEVNEIDSTCCGMAGAFGYEAEHYAISQQVGELSVLPAVRHAPEGTLIVAPGTSCRDQIEHFTGRQALHPIEVIARRLRELDGRQAAAAHGQNTDLTKSNT
jgi:Fe-S oxidoreductase